MPARRRYIKRWSTRSSAKRYAATRKIQRFARRNRRRRLTRRRPRMYRDLLPSTRRAQLRYTHLGDTGVTGSSPSQTFSLNSVHDPWVTGTGEKAQGAAHLAALYGKYIVNKAHIKIDWYRYGQSVTSGATTTNQEPYLLYITGDNDASPNYILPSASSIDKFSFGKTNKLHIMPMNQTKASLSMTYDAKLFARSKSPDITEYGAAFGYSPNMQYYCHIEGSTMDGSNLDSPSIAIKYLVTITYDITCFREEDAGIPA